MGPQCLSRGCKNPPNVRGYCEPHTRARKAARERIRAELAAPARNLPESEFVYIIGVEGYDGFKVGRSNDPIKRLAQLQTPLPMNMALLSVLCVVSMGATALERSAHVALTAQGHHIRGEWFKGSAESIEATIRGCASEIGTHVMTPNEVSAICLEHMARNVAGDEMIAFSEKIDRLRRVLSVWA